MEHNSDFTPERTHSRRARARGLGWALCLLVAGALVGGSGVYWLAHRGRAARPAAGAPEEKLLYQCPMHPTITADHPGDCPICGMKLVLVKPAATPPGPTSHTTGHGTGGNAAGDHEVSGLATVTIDPERQQLIGLRTAEVTRGVVSDTWRTTGRVEVDPTRVRKTNVKVEGYIERLYVDFVGREVKKGEPLFAIYSPSLLTAENEYVLALRMRDDLTRGGALAGDGDSLVASARRKLELWDVPPGEIARLDRTREPSRSVTYLSPIAGVVTAKNVVEGAPVNPGDTPYEITDLGMVWVMADAYETDLPDVRVGMPATLTTQGYPNRPFMGKVDVIDPFLDPKTRTAKVHLHFPNPQRLLKPEMFGEVVLEGTPREGLRVPADAVVRSGTKDVVFLALGDGKFAPREVQLGAKSGDLIEVVSGLIAGQKVVTRANFLVDSESQLRSSLSTIGGK
jgi:Cu(I)/Ag(I) efflux system membrane fusion protein